MLAGATALTAAAAAGILFSSSRSHDWYQSTSPSQIYQPAASPLVTSITLPLEERLSLPNEASSSPKEQDTRNTFTRQTSKLLEHYPGLFNPDIMASEFERLITKDFENFFDYLTNLTPKESLKKRFQITSANTRTEDMPWQNMKYSDGSRLTVQTDNSEKSTLSFYTQQPNATGKAEEYIINVNVMRSKDYPISDKDGMSYIMITASCGDTRTGRADIMFNKNSGEWELYLIKDNKPIKSSISSVGLQNIVTSLSHLNLQWKDNDEPEDF